MVSIRDVARGEDVLRSIRPAGAFTQREFLPLGSINVVVEKHIVLCRWDVGDE
jgi:hypothetical protein